MMGINCEKDLSSSEEEIKTLVWKVGDPCFGFHPRPHPFSSCSELLVHILQNETSSFLKPPCCG